MKVIYEANDGTKFESEVDCKNYETTQSLYDKSNKIGELLDIAFYKESDGYFYTTRNITNFIIENIGEINKILGVEPREKYKYTFKGGDCQEYVAVDDPDNSCQKCELKHTKYLEGGNCYKSKELFHCSHQNIIWIKK